MKIIIGGDLVPTESNMMAFELGDLETVVDEKIIDRINEADFRIYNLEVPLTDVPYPIKKCGPNLIATEKTLKGLLKLQPDLLGLANNHIMDQGREGLDRTVNLLDENNVSHCGAGMNLDKAMQPYYIITDDVKIGVYACAEHEFTIADVDYPGANPYDPLVSFDHVREMKKNCDCVIVLYHGGKEFYRYPSPRLQATCRKFAETGADIVICQHSHCVGCRERYHETEIVYGQGNFIFDRGSDEFWNSGLLVEVSVDKERTNINYIPIEKQNGKYYLATGSQIVEGFRERSERIVDKDFVRKNYSEFCKNNVQVYYKIFRGRSFFQRVLNKLKLNRFTENDLVQIRNCIECEAIQELVIGAIRQETNTK